MRIPQGAPATAETSDGLDSSISWTHRVRRFLRGTGAHKPDVAAAPSRRKRTTDQVTSTPLSSKDLEVLNQLRKNPGIHRKQIGTAVGWHDVTVGKSIRKLQQSGFDIWNEGGGKGYFLIEDPSQPNT